MRPFPARPGADALVDEAVRTAVEGLDLFERRAYDVARDFRWNRLGDALQGLAEVVHGLQAIVTLVSAMAETPGGASNDEGEAVHAADRTRLAVGELIRYQRTGDWPALADALEYDLVPAIHRWRAVIETTGEPGGDPGPDGWAA